MKIAIITTLCILVPAFGPVATQPQTDEVFQAGEELTYSVKWNFFRLGTVIIRTQIDSTDTNLVRAEMIVESASGLPFISVRDVNRSIITRDNSKTLQYTGRHQNGDETVLIEYEYDRETRILASFEKNLTDNIVTQQEVTQDIPPFVDGNALFFYARWRSRSGKTFRVPTVVGGKLSYTFLTYSGEKEDLEIGGVSHPIAVRKYTGHAEWNGGTSAGITGEFTGWVSDDLAAVPVRAEMKIALGSITLELEKWQRDGWRPPSSLQTLYTK